MIRQLNTLGEGRVKMAVQYKGCITFLTSMEMKIRKHCEHDNKDIMMVNMTFMWQWNEQFYKPSGRQVLLKRDKFIKPISYHFFFPRIFSLQYHRFCHRFCGTTIEGKEWHLAAR